MCELSGVSRAGFYRHWEESAPRQADTALRDAIQQVILKSGSMAIDGCSESCGIAGSASMASGCCA
jgi:hypothetical protein